MTLSEQSLRNIDREVAKYPAEGRRSAVMAALAVAQDQYGWIPMEAIEEVATYLRLPAIAVQEIATFYNMFDLKPVGRYKVSVCTNLPCALSGGERAARHLQEKLGIGFGETTADGGFTLVEGECMGACGDAPVLIVNNKRMCSFMSDAKIDALVAELQGTSNP
jgi:NADH-quinone oxidoreductase subunit E